jgi:sec-independent protein translocase protein TatC
MESEEKELTLQEHLVELAQRARTALLALIISSIAVAVVPANPREAITNPLVYRPLVGAIIEKLKQDFLPSNPNVELIAGTWGGPIMVYLYASLILGFLISSPVIAYEFFMFINPGLRESERAMLKRYLVPFAILFAAGVVYGYLFIVPITFRFLTRIGAVWVGATMHIFIEDFLKMTLGILAVCGLFFTIPLLAVVAVRAGLVKLQTLKKNRRYLYGGLLILLCIMTPDPTLLTDILLFAPFFVLMEGALLVARRYEKLEISGRA